MPAEEIVRAVVQSLGNVAWFAARCPHCNRRLLDFRPAVVEGEVEIMRICPECKREVRLFISGSCCT